MATTKTQSPPRPHGHGGEKPFSLPASLTVLEREAAIAVLEEAGHKLAVLGGIMPDYASSAQAVEQVRLTALWTLSHSHSTD